MRVLFIHQNFPAQFKHLAPALVERGHEVVALTLRVEKPLLWHGVKVLPYALPKGRRQSLHPWLVDMDTKMIRATACYQAARALREQGFTPDVIVAHPGWGESLFLKDVWPGARLGLYCELYHRDDHPHAEFDPEFPSPAPELEPMRLRMKNLNNRLHFEIADAGISPTRFQADTFPEPFRERISVIHDGIDTDLLAPDAAVRFALADGSTLGREDEVVTFINRNLEPYRGYHVFMRALPELLRTRPQARVLVVGGDEVSYGARPKGDKSWKQIFIDEVRPDIPDADWARVHFLGRIPYDRFRALLQVSRVHLYLTYPFVLSWSLFETMSCGGAIVASDTAPVREAIEHDRTGLLVDFFDGSALVAECARLLDDEALRDRLGQAARRHVIEKYDLRTVCLPRQLDWIDRLAALAPRAPTV